MDDGSWDMVRTLLRRWWHVVTVCLVLGAIAGTYYAVARPPSYTANSYVLVSPSVATGSIETIKTLASLAFSQQAKSLGESSTSSHVKGTSLIGFWSTASSEQLAIKVANDYAAVAVEVTLGLAPFVMYLETRTVTIPHTTYIISPARGASLKIVAKSKVIVGGAMIGGVLAGLIIGIGETILFAIKPKRLLT